MYPRNLVKRPGIKRKILSATELFCTRTMVFSVHIFLFVFVCCFCLFYYWKATLFFLLRSIKICSVFHGKKNANFKCETCNFTTTSKAGLQIHMKRKHTQIDKEKFPKSCELCDKVLKDTSELKIHLQEHSYKFISFQCSFAVLLLKTDGTNVKIVVIFLQT